MTGPEHYREGERALSAASHLREPGGPPLDPQAAAHQVALSQAHFTAALTAATALQAALSLIGDDQQVTEWSKAVGVTIATNQGARLTSALLLINEMEEDGRIVDGADRLRAALGQTAGDR